MKLRFLGSTVVQLAQDNGIPTTVDPKKRNFNNYSGTTLFKPNLKELREGLNLDIQPELDSLNGAVCSLRADMDWGMALVTLSEKGAYICA